MDNRITLLGIVHFKKINGIRSTRFNILYLSSGIEDDIKVKRIEAYGNEDIVTRLTNGMMAVITGQILYSSEEERFLVKVDNALPVKDRSGQAEETIIIQNGNSYNQIYLRGENKDGFIKTHPKPVPGDINFNGVLDISGLKELDLLMNYG